MENKKPTVRPFIKDEYQSCRCESLHRQKDKDIVEIISRK